MSGYFSDWLGPVECLRTRRFSGQGLSEASLLRTESKVEQGKKKKKKTQTDQQRMCSTNPQTRDSWNSFSCWIRMERYRANHHVSLSADSRDHRISGAPLLNSGLILTLWIPQPQSTIGPCVYALHHWAVSAALAFVFNKALPQLFLSILHSQSVTFVLWVLPVLPVHPVPWFSKFYLVVKFFAKQNLTTEDSASHSAHKALYVLNLELPYYDKKGTKSVPMHVITLRAPESGSLMATSFVYDR